MPSMFAHLLGSHEEKAADSSDEMSTGKHAAMKDFMAAVAGGDHVAASSAMEDWHELHKASGADASMDSTDTEPDGVK